ncbi:MAG TPA: DUF2461 domain-containing protein [Calditrichia bacterium]|nr:DUF2461 domain-containing protein [Calditrichota bacterium]HQU72738.1 DUF2461 domain-containing protein [Calditrichia bacterium]HQV31802.1 DUF2461 domain-containing protein [Calditrichia bacterium]
MAYFSEEFIRFFEELADNNERDWFLDNKKRYESHVKKPVEAFVAAMVGLVQEIDPAVNITPKEALFRINRDIRFSKDKRPYKTHVGAIISAAGRRNMQVPGLYLQLGVDGIMIAGGLYQPDKDNLYQVRKALAARGGELVTILADPAFREMFGELGGEKNKILPKEFKEAAAEMPLIAHKQFFVATPNYHPQLMIQENFPNFVMDHYRTLRPLNSFLKKAIGLGD